MLIKTLKIVKGINRELIREISFNTKGLNLIIDNTTKQSTESGNNVGKTTAVKIIDICCGADKIKDIYYDKDTNSENIIVKKFLDENKVYAELVLINKLNEKDEFVIKRELFSRGSKYINNKKVNTTEFRSILKKKIFKLNEEKPTLRQLIPKFIRINDETSSNVIKYLSGYQSNLTYNLVYSYLFGLYDDKSISDYNIYSNRLLSINKKIKEYERELGMVSFESLKQKQKFINSTLDELYLERENINYDEKYQAELNNKRNILLEIDYWENKIELIDLDISLMEKNIFKMQKERENIDTKILKNIYQEVEKELGSINKKFNELVDFHNSMISNRIIFIRENLDKKRKEQNTCIQKRDELIEQQKELATDLSDDNLLREITRLSTRIEEMSFQNGEVAHAIKILKNIYEEKDQVVKLLDDLELTEESKTINEKILEFNDIFSKYCETLYGERYLFSYNKDWEEGNKSPIGISALSGSVGIGMKKCIAVAFDLAYTNYAIKEKIPGPKFVIHDKMENTHINQINTIFALCEETEGQFIVPILKERIESVDSEIIDKAKILELSEKNKFFRIES